MPPRRSARISDPKPPSDFKGSSGKPASKKVTIPKVSWLSLPLELKVEIFAHVLKPSMRDLKKYARTQVRLTEYCLICKGLLEAAKAVLLQYPLFIYASGSPRTSFVKAFDMDKEEANDAARQIRSFAMTRLLGGTHNKASRVNLMEGVFDLSALSSLHLQVASSTPAIGLREVITVLERRDGKCRPSLVHIRLEGFSTAAKDVADQLAWFFTLPRLQTLHLQLASSKIHQTEIDLDGSTNSNASTLRYLVFDFDEKLTKEHAELILAKVPQSLVTFAFLATFSRTTNLDALRNLPDLQYLALQSLPTANPFSPSPLP